MNAKWILAWLAIRAISAAAAGPASPALIPDAKGVLNFIHDREGSEPARHRLIILADMGNEPDEEQQIAHMLREPAHAS